MEVTQIDNIRIMAYATIPTLRAVGSPPPPPTDSDGRTVYYTDDSVFAWRPDDDPPPHIAERALPIAWPRPGATVRVTRAAYEKGKR